MMKNSYNRPQNPQMINKKQGMSAWKGIAICMTVILLPWALYVNFHPRFESIANVPVGQVQAENPHDLGQRDNKVPEVERTIPVKRDTPIVTDTKPKKKLPILSDMPVLGPVPTNGAQPLYNIKHKGTDAIFALACNYPKLYYQRFVGSLRKFGYEEDIVLAVSPEEKMKPGLYRLFIAFCLLYFTCLALSLNLLFLIHLLYLLQVSKSMLNNKTLLPMVSMLIALDQITAS